MSRERKFISGEWSVSDEVNENVFGEAISTSVLDENGFPVCVVEATPILHNWPWRYPEMAHWADGAEDGRTLRERTVDEVTGTAHLLAAAPDLLDALEEAINWDGWDELGEPEVWLDRAKAAIAKAHGEQE